MRYRLNFKGFYDTRESLFGPSEAEESNNPNRRIAGIITTDGTGILKFEPIEEDAKYEQKTLFGEDEQ